MKKTPQIGFLLRVIKHLPSSMISIIAEITALTGLVLKPFCIKWSKKNYEKLKASEERYRGLLESAQDAIIITDTKGCIAFANAQVTNWFGYVREELIGQQIEIFVLDPVRDAHAQYKSEYLAHLRRRPMGRPGLNFIGRRKDGSEFPVDITLSPSQSSEGKIITAIIRDITERNALEAERIKLYIHNEKEARNAAKMAIAARDEFLLAAAHELRTPLTSLMLQAHMIKKYFDHISQKIPAEEKAMSNLLALQIQFKNLDVLINKVLEASRASVEKLKLDLSEVDLSALVREISHSLQEETNKAEYLIEIHADQPVIGLWDRARIEVVITNLFTNAIKFGNRKPIIIKVESDKEKAILTVEDHGIGIAEEDQAKLFLKFERFASLDYYPGMGLGLYITRQITEAHGGTINVKSELGHGSTFTVELPLKPLPMN